MKEIWKKIKGHSDYQISNHGNVIGKYKNKGYIGTIKKNCNKIVNLNNRDIMVAYLVLTHFGKKHPTKKYINFKDYNRENCSIENLKWSYQRFFTQKTIDNRRTLIQKRQGKKHWRSRPFKAEGKKFFTLKEASIKLKIPCLDTIKKRLVNKNRKDYTYI